MLQNRSSIAALEGPGESLSSILSREICDGALDEWQKNPPGPLGRQAADSQHVDRDVKQCSHVWGCSQCGRVIKSFEIRIDVETLPSECFHEGFTGSQGWRI